MLTTEKNTDIIKKFVNYETLKKLYIPIISHEKNNFPYNFSVGISVDLPKIIVFDENRNLQKELNIFNNLKL